MIESVMKESGKLINPKKNLKIEARRMNFMASVHSSHILLRLDYTTKLRKQRLNNFFNLQRTIVDSAQIEDICSDLLKYKENIELTHHLLRKLKASLTISTDVNLDLNVIEQLVSLLDSSSHETILEAECILADLSMSENKYCQYIISLDGHLKLLKLILFPDPLIQKQAVRTLGNIAGSGSMEREKLLHAGVLKQLNTLLEKNIDYKELIEDLCCLVYNLFKGNNKPKVKDIAKFLELINILLKSKDNQLVPYALIGLQGVTKINVQNIKYVVNKISIKEIINCADSKETRNEALKVLGNMCMGCAKSVKKLLDQPFLQLIAKILTAKDDNEAVKECCWLLSNIALGPPSHIQHLIDNFIPKLLCNIITTIGYFNIRKKAMYALINVYLNATTFQVFQICLVEVFDAIIQMVNIEDSQLIISILKVLDRVFELNKEGLVLFESLGGVKKLEELQLHPNVDVINKGCEILDKYFDDGELEFKSDEEMEEMI